MAVKSRQYDRFGNFILFKRLEEDAIGELWRAGQIEGDSLVGPLAVRRLSGGDRGGWIEALEEAAPFLPSISGTTVVKDQRYLIVDDIPVLAHDYSGGRSLRHIIEKARGGVGHPNPIPVDQALAIAEKVAASVEILTNLKRSDGRRLAHGAVLPQFVWITDDGEVRVAGQMLGRGILASLKREESARHLTGFVAPEIRSSGEPSKASDVYSLGALLYLVLTGQEPPDPLHHSAFDAAVAGTALMAGGVIPEDIRPILRRSFAVDPAARYPSAAELHHDLRELVSGGRYAPTTFNLAFYLHNLLKKEMDVETLERGREEMISLKAYTETSPLLIPAVPRVEILSPAPEAPVADAPMFASAYQTPRRSKLPLIATGLIVAVVATGAYLLIGREKKAAAAPPSPARATQAPARVAPVPMTPVITAVVEPGSSTVTETTGSAGANLSDEQRKKAIEAAVNRKLQEEMMKLQVEYDRDRQRREPAEEPQPRSTVATAPSSPVEENREEAEPSASELDQQQRAQSRDETPAAPAPSTQAPQTVAIAPVVAQPGVASTREGDLVEIGQVDQSPRLLSQVRPTYPPLAMRQRIEASVILSVLVSETGRVVDVKVLRGDNRKLGFDDAAVRAIRSATFSPAVKEGKRVRTWVPVPIKFQL